MAYGVVRTLEDGKVELYTYKAGFSGVTYVVKNLGTRSLNFTQDCSTSKNISSNRGNLKVTITIPPGEAKVLHALAPKTSVGSWQAGYTASYEWVA